MEIDDACIQNITRLMNERHARELREFRNSPLFLATGSVHESEIEYFSAQANHVALEDERISVEKHLKGLQEKEEKALTARRQAEDELFKKKAILRRLNR